MGLNVGSIGVSLFTGGSIGPDDAVSVCVLFSSFLPCFGTLRLSRCTTWPEGSISLTRKSVYLIGGVRTGQLHASLIADVPLLESTIKA